MSFGAVEQEIRRVMEVADKFGGWISEHETANRYAVIDPILWALGWQTHLPWECRVEVKRGKQGRADYVLLDGQEKPVIIIEAKGLYGGSNYSPTNFRKKLASYSRGITQGVAVLTDGWTWEIYDLGEHSVSFESKRKACVDFNFHNPRESARVLHQWLRKERWQVYD